jgi:hypothetical protein
MDAGFWRGNLKKGVYLVELGIDGMIILKWILVKCGVGEGWRRSVGLIM